MSLLELIDRFNYLVGEKMMGLDLTNAVVVGFFSLPSPSLAEQNPSAYNAAMREVPKGAGSCQHCGTGILHHVVIRIGAERHFIGQDCANRVGSPMVRRCVRERLTAEQIEQREAKAKAAQAAWRAAEEAQQWDSIYERCVAEETDGPTRCACVGLEDCAVCD